MSNLPDRPKTALLVIDVQNGVVANAHDRDARGREHQRPGRPRRARRSAPVVWVQHTSEELAHRERSWQYVPELHARRREPLVQKRYGDSFEDTSWSRCWRERVSAGRRLPARRPTRASGPRCTARSPGLRRRPGLRRAHHRGPVAVRRARRRRRSSPTPTCTGSTRHRPLGRAAPIRREHRRRLLRGGLDHGPDLGIGRGRRRALGALGRWWAEALGWVVNTQHPRSSDPARRERAPRARVPAGTGGGDAEELP